MTDGTGAHEAVEGAPGADAVPGIDEAPLTEWLAANVAGSKPPFTFEVIAGGHSNLTYMVSDSAGQRYVLRRPPLGHTLASAHDVGREHRIISALAGTDVPVAPALAMCTDTSVLGVPFYVMAFVDGLVIRTADIAAKSLDLAARDNASRSIVTTLARLHAVDPMAVGLGDLGRHEGYIARQLKRWYGQYQAQHTTPVPALDRVHDALVARIPEQGPARIVHGDYRLDNCMVDRSGNVVAVLDWEICTLGDPLADLGLLMVYWTGPTDGESAWRDASTQADGFWSRADIAAEYAKVTGRDISQLDYYTAFAFWKLSCILEGVYTRYLGGAMGDRDPEDLKPFREQVEAAAAQAELTLERIS